jgi:hypothetical protein
VDVRRAQFASDSERDETYVDPDVAVLESSNTDNGGPGSIEGID